MKILCLHGAGLNGDLMKRQLGPIIAALDQAYEFVFIDGDIETSAAPGVPEQVPGPFFSYYKAFDGNEIRDACDLIDMTIEEEGPFEGLIGFSQGAALGVSYMLDRSINRPSEDCPFRWSLLLSSVLAFSPDPSYLDFEFAMFDAQNDLDKNKEKSTKPWWKSKNSKPKPLGKFEMPDNKASMLKSQSARLTFRDEWMALIKACIAFAEIQGRCSGRMMEQFDELSAQVTADDFSAGGSRSPRLYHPMLTAERLSIPIVLCTGGREPFEGLQQSALVSRLCDNRTTVNMQHRGGHEIPRDSTSIQAIVSATKKAIEDSRWTSSKAPLRALI